MMGLKPGGPAVRVFIPVRQRRGNRGCANVRRLNDATPAPGAAGPTYSAAPGRQPKVWREPTGGPTP